MQLVSVLPLGDIVCLKYIISYESRDSVRNQSRDEAMGNFRYGLGVAGRTILVLIAFVILYSIFSDGDSETSVSPSTTTAKIEDRTANEGVSIDSKEYQDLEYSDIARQKDGMEGEHIYFTGQVLQTGTSWGDVYARVAKNGVSNQVFYVMIADDKLDINLLENDYVYIEGTLAGLKSYTNVLGSQVTIPEVEADLVELQ